MPNIFDTILSALQSVISTIGGFFGRMLQSNTSEQSTPMECPVIPSSQDPAFPFTWGGDGIIKLPDGISLGAATLVLDKGTITTGTFTWNIDTLQSDLTLNPEDGVITINGTGVDIPEFTVGQSKITISGATLVLQRTQSVTYTTSNFTINRYDANYKAIGASYVYLGDISGDTWNIMSVSGGTVTIDGKTVTGMKFSGGTVASLKVRGLDVSSKSFAAVYVPLNVSFVSAQTKALSSDPSNITVSQQIWFVGPSIETLGGYTGGVFSVASNLTSRGATTFVFTWNEGILFAPSVIQLNGVEFSSLSIDGRSATADVLLGISTNSGAPKQLLSLSFNPVSGVTWAYDDGGSGTNPTYPIKITSPITITASNYDASWVTSSIYSGQISGKAVNVTGLTVTGPSSCNISLQYRYTFALPSKEDEIKAILPANIAKVSLNDIESLGPDQVKAMSFEQLYEIIKDSTKVNALEQSVRTALNNASTIIQVAGSGNTITFAGNGSTYIALTFAGTTKANIVGGVNSSTSGWKASWSLINAGSVRLNSIKGSVTIGGNTLQFGASGNNVKFTVNSGGSVQFNEFPASGAFRDRGDNTRFDLKDRVTTLTLTDTGKVQIGGLTINAVIINSIQFDFSKVSINNQNNDSTLPYHIHVSAGPYNYINP